MNKRTFLVRGAALLAAWPVAAVARKKPAAAPPPPVVPGPTLLTMSGAITRSNRGATDPAQEPLFARQAIHFDKAWALSFADLTRMPANELHATLPFDGKLHTLRGPYLAQVLATAGAATRDNTRVVLHGLDGTPVSLSLGGLRQYRFIVATHMDGQPLALGGLGPLWAMYAADQFADKTAKPLAERYLDCPWGLYHIEVQTG